MFNYYNRCRNNTGYTPLHKASLGGHLNVIHYLLAECKCDSMCKNGRGYTPLRLASYGGHMHVIKYLITECKCNPLFNNNIGSPFHVAVLESHLNIVKYL